VRQNLALVVGLQGRFQEAETIAKGDLSPDEAAANVAYLRQMLAQQGDWKKKASAVRRWSRRQGRKRLPRHAAARAKRVKPKSDARSEIDVEFPDWPSAVPE
jgi:hypothetical protein